MGKQIRKNTKRYEKIQKVAEWENRYKKKKYKRYTNDEKMLQE